MQDFLGPGPASKRSLVRRVSLIVVLLFLFTFPLITGAFIVTAMANARANAYEESRRLGAYLAGILPDPIWELSSGSIRSIGETLAREGTLSRLLIEDNQRGILFSYDAPAGPSARGFSAITVPIEKNGITIGLATYSVAFERYGAEVTKTTAIILAVGGLALILFLFALRLAMRRELKRPLEGLMDLVEGYRSGDPAPVLSAHLSYLEFSPLVDVLTRMGGTITAQLAELRELNGELEKRVAERTAELEARNGELSAERDRVAHWLSVADGANRAKSEFLANMSHELRTPLNAVLGFSQLIAKDEAVDEETRRKADLVNESGRHLLAIINDILDVSRIEAKRFELVSGPFSLQESLSFVESMLKARADEKGLSFTLEVAGSLPETVRGDERRIRQILLNLAANAVKFTTQGGVRIQAAYIDSFFHFRVEDSGPGIPPERIEGLFRPFERIRANAEYIEGAGLGLAISKSLVGLMGGEIGVESALGKGSSFWLKLPLASEPGTGGVPHRLVNPTGYEGRRRAVLIVDDNKNNCDYFASLLSPLGFEVRTAPDGFSALAAAKLEAFDLVLLDYRMPGMDGGATAQGLRALEGGRPQPVIIGVSASLNGGDGESSFAQDCDEFLGKPVEASELLAVIGRHLDLSWTGLVEPSPEMTESEVEGPKPSPAQVARILEAASRGDYRLVEESLKDMEAGGWTGAAKARRLAARYDDQGLELLFRPYLKEGS